MPSCNISDGVCLVFFFVFLLFFFLCLCVSLACFLPPAFFISFPSLLLLLALSCTLGANQKYAHTNTVNFLFSSCVPLRLLGWEKENRIETRWVMRLQDPYQTFLTKQTKVVCGWLLVSAFLTVSVGGSGVSKEQQKKKSLRTQVVIWTAARYL